MPELSVVSETLHVPLLGRIYTSKHDPKVLYDKAALALEPKLPASVEQVTGQNEYTYLASAVRSKNVDAAIGVFLAEHPRGTVVNVGCGLETAICAMTTVLRCGLSWIFQRYCNSGAGFFRSRNGIVICRIRCSTTAGSTL